VGEVTVNDNVLSFPLSCPLLSYFVMSLHTDCVRVYACVRKERERERETKTEREPRAANGRRRSEGQASARARKRVKGTGHHKDAKNERKKNALQSNGRLFDALPLVVVRVLVGDGDDVLFSSFFLALHFSLALFFALHATSGLSSHTMLPVLLTTNRFFFRCSSFSPQKDQRQRQKKM